MTSWRDRLSGNALYWLSQSLVRTARYDVCGFEHVDAARSAGRPIIFVAWHGMTMMLAGFFRRHYDLARLLLLMPDDWRGEALAHWARRLGATPFRLNLHGDETLATARGLARLLRALRDGHDSYVTPDGPDGPAYVVKPGVAFLAQRSDAIVLPAGAYTRRGYRVNRWDTYVVPYPFSRIALVVGEPVPAPAAVPLGAIVEPLTNALHRVAAAARAAYYEGASGRRELPSGPPHE